MTELPENERLFAGVFGYEPNIATPTENTVKPKSSTFANKQIFSSVFGYEPNIDDEGGGGYQEKVGAIKDSVNQWNPIIDKYASLYPSVPKAVVRSMIQQESSGNPDITGPETTYGQARGLGQFIDDTAQRYIPDWSGPEDSYNPDKNVHGMFRYLGDLIKDNGLDEAVRLYHGKGSDPLGVDDSRYYNEVMGRIEQVAPDQDTIESSVVPSDKTNHATEVVPKRPIEATRSFGDNDEIPISIPQYSSDPEVAKIEAQFNSAPDVRSKALSLKSLPMDKGTSLIKSLPEVEQESVKSELEKLTNEDRKGNAFALGLLQSTPIPTFFKKETKEELAKVTEASPVESTVGQVVGTVGQAIVGGHAIGKLLGKVGPIVNSPLLKTALTRVATSGAIAAGQNIGRKEIGEAIGDVVQQSGGGLVSLVPEVLAPPGVAQLIAQPLGDLIYDVAAGVVRGQDVGSKKWWKNEIVSLASSAGFSIRDVAAGKTFKAEQLSQRKELGKLIGKGDLEVIGEGIKEIKATPEQISQAKEMAKEIPGVTFKEEYPGFTDPKTGNTTQEPLLMFNDEVTGSTKTIKPGESVDVLRTKIEEVRAQQKPKETTDVPEIQGKTETEVGEAGADDKQFNIPIKKEGLDERGSVDLSAGGKAVKQVKKFLVKNLTSRGNLPEDVFQKKLDAEHWVNAELKEIGDTANEFKKTASKVYRTERLKSEDAIKIDNVLKGNEPLSSIDTKLQPVVQKMRDHIDVLSQRMIDAGVVEGNLAATVKENMGAYANRSFRVFNDPKWSEKVPVETRNRAKAFIRDEYKDLPDERIEGVIDELLYKDGAPISVMSTGKKLGSKALGILKRRKDIPPEIRALWGEYKDADVNYANSVAKMSKLIANHKFLTDVKNDGLGRIFFEEPIVKDGNSYSVKIAADKSPTMSPLNGLYTTKEIKEAFEKTGNNAEPGWLRALVTASSTAKYAKTILSPMTHLRNITGNVAFAIANGHVDVTKAPNAISSTFKDFKGVGDQELKAKLKEYRRLGVIGTGARQGEIKAIINDATQGNIDIMVGTGPKRRVLGAVNGVEKLYGAEDDVWKIYAFENEFKRYKKALPDISDEELKKKVADIVKNTYPTYEMIPELVKRLRKVPFIGSFVSFPAEVIRTATNTVKLAVDELKDPATRAIGSQRLAGILTATTMTGVAATASRYLTGNNKKKDEANRSFIGPWSKNSQLIYLGKDEDGNQKYIDLGYTDPHAYLKSIVVAAMRGEDIEKKAVGIATEVLSPFISEDLMTQKLVDISRNKRKDGKQIWNEQDGFGNKMVKGFIHVIDAVTPGAITGAKRMYLATKGEEGKYGQKYDFGTELTAQSTGIRTSKINIPKSLKFKAIQLRKDLIEAGRLRYSDGEAPDSDNRIVKANKEYIEQSMDSKKLVDDLKGAGASESRAYSEGQKVKIRNEFRKVIKDAMVTGLSKKEVYSVITEAGLPKKSTLNLILSVGGK